MSEGEVPREKEQPPNLINLTAETNTETEPIEEPRIINATPEAFYLEEESCRSDVQVPLHSKRKNKA